MIRDSSPEFGKDAGRCQDLARGEPGVITRDRRDRHVLAAGELPDKVVDAVAHTSMDDRHGDLDELLKDWAP